MIELPPPPREKTSPEQNQQWLETLWRKVKEGSDYISTILTNVATLDFATSEVVVFTGNGHGSTNTAIRRFSNIETETGTDITYADSVTLGASFTINTAGIYAMHYTDIRTGAAFFMGISKNSNQLTTAINSISSTNRVTANDQASSIYMNVSATLSLAANDVIRPHTDGNANGTTSLTKFRIVRLR